MCVGADALHTLGRRTASGSQFSPHCVCPRDGMWVSRREKRVPLLAEQLYYSLCGQCMCGGQRTTSGVGHHLPPRLKGLLSCISQASWWDGFWGMGHHIRLLHVPRRFHPRPSCLHAKSHLSNPGIHIFNNSSSLLFLVLSQHRERGQCSVHSLLLVTLAQTSV